MNGRSRIGLIAVVVAGVTLASATTGAAQDIQVVTLDEAVDMARHVNPAIIQAEGQLDNAGAAKRQAMGAWLPSLSLSSGYSTQPGREVLDPTTNTLVTPTTSSANGSVGASLVIFNGFRRTAENRSARKSSKECLVLLARPYRGLMVSDFSVERY